IQRFSEHTDTIEFETMGKMVLLSGVILPILPDHSINHLVPLSPFKIWMAVVIISGISYAGYIVQKYLFPNRGYYLTGLIGGIYSSTATTVVLAKKMAIYEERVLDAGIIAATAMMYLRLIIVAAIFNLTIAKEILIPFCVFSGLGFIVSLLFLQAKENDMESAILVDANPLELGTAFLFAVLFVVMMSVTTYVTQTYGLQGLKILSFITGLSDIDPFVLSLLTGEYGVTQDQIVAAILIAAGSNNLLKGVYALWFGGIRKSFRSALVVSLLGAGTIAWAFWI
ncbi:MAG: beta-carotene 15,15'-monooxygenase, partial [Sulfurimonas sp.]